MTIMYKILFVGDRFVGKSALTIQYTLNHFIEGDYDPIEDESMLKVAQIEKNDDYCHINIYDMIHDNSIELRDNIFKEREGFIIVYSITSRISFNNCVLHRDKILNLFNKDDVSIILVGNKCDLDNERQVLYNEGKELAQQFNCSFYETSAKTRTNVEEMLFDCARQIKRIKHNKQNVNTNDNIKKNKCYIM